MKVIGGGLGRTGTKSLQTALQILGFDPCYHMTEILEKNINHAIFWEQAIQGQPVDWHGVLGRYEAGVDMPVSQFVPELLQAYPQSKVVLTVRDPERWYDSMYETVYQLTHTPKLLSKLVPLLKRFTKMTRAVVWNGFFDGRFLEREFAIQKFNEHNAYIKQIVPPEQLLVFHVKEGWEPLCAFLDVPVPNEPFPYVNDRQEMLKRVAGMKKGENAVRMMLVGLVAGLLWWLWRKM